MAHRTWRDSPPENHSGRSPDLEPFQIGPIHRRSITMRIKLTHIAPLLAAGAAALAGSAAPPAAAAATIVQPARHAQIPPQPGVGAAPAVQPHAAIGRG